MLLNQEKSACIEFSEFYLKISIFSVFVVSFLICRVISTREWRWNKTTCSSNNSNTAENDNKGEINTFKGYPDNSNSVPDLPLAQDESLLEFFTN